MIYYLKSGNHHQYKVNWGTYINSLPKETGSLGKEGNTATMSSNTAGQLNGQATGMSNGREC